MPVHYLRLFLLLTSLLFVLSACSDAEWEGSHSFAEDQWQYQDSVRFVFNNDDTDKRRLLAFGLDLNTDYPYRNIYIKFRTTTPSGKTTESLRQFILADAKGEWFVDQTFSGTLEFRQALLENVVFNEAGEYVFEYKHYMRGDTLPGVEATKLVVFDMPQTPESDFPDAPPLNPSGE